MRGSRGELPSRARADTLYFRCKNRVSRPFRSAARGLKLLAPGTVSGRTQARTRAEEEKNAPEHRKSGAFTDFQNPQPQEPVS